MDERLKHDLILYLFAFLGNTHYHDKNYLISLYKKYGKKVVNKAMKKVRKNGKISDAFVPIKK